MKRTLPNATIPNHKAQFRAITLFRRGCDQDCVKKARPNRGNARSCTGCGEQNLTDARRLLGSRGYGYDVAGFLVKYPGSEGFRCSFPANRRRECDPLQQHRLSFRNASMMPISAWLLLRRRSPLPHRRGQAGKPCEFLRRLCRRHRPPPARFQFAAGAEFRLGGRSGFGVVP